MSKILVVPVLLTALVMATPRAGAEPGDCSTPRSAVQSVFEWQNPAQRDLARATSCLERAGRSQTAAEKLAQRIHAIYAARGLVVDFERFSDDKDWVDPETGRAEVTPHPSLPKIIVRKMPSGRWLWTSQALIEVDASYESTLGTLEAIVSRLPAWMRADVFGLKFWQLLALSLVLVVGLVVRKIIEYIVKARIRNLVENLGQRWAIRLVDVFASPGATVVMALLLRIAHPHLALPAAVSAAVEVAVRIMVTFSMVWAIYRLVDVFAERMAEKAERTQSKLDDQLVPLVRKALKIVTVVAGTLFVLQNLSVNVGSLLAGLGIGGVAIALAAKDTVANFFGSIMIFVDKPFQIGDWVGISGVEGIVEEVGFRSTRIRTFYNSLVTVPNAKFTEASIDNYGQRHYRRTYVTLNVTYDTTPSQMQAFVEGIRAIIASNEFTRKDYYEVHMSGFGASSLDVMVYFFFKVPSWSEELRQRHNVFLEIMRLARDLSISFAFPTQTLHVESLAAPGAERQLPEPPQDNALSAVVQAFGPGGTRARPRGPHLTDGYFAGTEHRGGNADS
ncbi:MAG TPA: mechanosensitive ion channel family protein [Polyangiaceae bacterium]